MQRLTLTIPVGSFLPGDAFDVFVNADLAGRVLADVDFNRSAIGGRQAFWPLIPSGPGFLDAGLGDGQFLGVPETVPADHQVVTPELYCGVYRFAVMTYDPLGNASSGTPAEFAVPVNSGPRAVRNFRQTTVAADGRPVFGFTPPAQLS